MGKPVNKPHKHAAMIIAWASGHAIQYRNGPAGVWYDVDLGNPGWLKKYEYRIKPEEDKVVYAHVHRRGESSAHLSFTCGHIWNVVGKPCFTDSCNVKFTFDGETNELKHVEVIKP